MLMAMVVLVIVLSIRTSTVNKIVVVVESSFCLLFVHVPSWLLVIDHHMRICVLNETHTTSCIN